MTHALPAYHQLLRANQDLPDVARSSMVVLRFLKPLPIELVNEFLRLHLTPAMLTGGEEQFYAVEVAQPQKLQKPLCAGCWRPLAQFGEWAWVCLRPDCRLEHRVQSTKPSRGVVRVLTQAELDAVLNRRPLPARFQQGEVTPLVALVLDRRYHEIVLAAIYRTAGQLAEQLGWRVK